MAPDLSTIPRESSRLTLRAPVSARAGDLAGLFDLPDISGLSTVAKDERAVPLGNTTLLSMGPGGFGRIMTGRPTGTISNWSDTGETSISYVRPHVSVEMMLALEMPGAGHASDFEGPGMTLHAVLDIDHRSKVDSTQIGQRTNQFGGRPAPTPVDEPQTAVAVGLDMGILPTFLAQMGVSLSVVVSRGQETGDSRVALVGVTELPVDWTPREHPEQHPTGVAQPPLGMGGVSALTPRAAAAAAAGRPAPRRGPRPRRPQRRSPRTRPCRSRPHWASWARRPQLSWRPGGNTGNN